MILYIICIALAGAFNAVMDKLQFHGLGGTSSFWNPQLSWKNKYKERGHTFVANIIEKLDNNVFVFLTDGWHLMKWCMTTCFIIPIIPNNQTVWMWLVWFLGIKAIFGLMFTLFFDLILKNKKEAKK